VILMMDGDRAGRSATEVIAHKLQSCGASHVIHLPDGVQHDQPPIARIQQTLSNFPASHYAGGAFERDGRGLCVAKCYLCARINLLSIFPAVHDAFRHLMDEQ
jgi:hypothetical protein